MPSTPLFAPREFFAQRSPSLAGAAIIFLLTGIVAAASAVPVIGQFSQIEFSAGVLVVAIPIGGAIGAAGIWTVSTFVVYLLSGAVGGSGSLSRVAANVGWAALPLLLVNTISTVTIWAFAVKAGLLTLSPTQMQLPWWILLVNSLIGIIGYLWIGYLLTYAIQDARGLTVRRSALVAAIVVLVPILNVILNLL